MELAVSNAYMETYSGMAVPISKSVTMLDIDLEDIWVSLSRINRYLGHTSRTMSVLEHSLLVAMLLEKRDQPPAIILAGLMHDAKEAYLGDIPTPVKRALGPEFAAALDELERAFDCAIAFHADIDFELIYSPEVKQADVDVLMLESSKLCASGGVDWKFSRPVTYQMGELDWENYHEDLGKMPLDQLIGFVKRKFASWKAQMQQEHMA